MTLHTVFTAVSVYLILIHASMVANSAMDPYKALNIILNPNGTLTRLSISPQSPPSPDPSLPTPALHWIKASNDAWLRHADYSRCYLMGESAGGNIAYTAGLRAAAEVGKLKPLKIAGLILIQPFFGGKKRSPSEIRLAEDNTIPLPITDLMWNLSLPVGVDRDYPYSNPTINGGDKILDELKVLGWRVAVFGCEGDPLVARERELVKLLEHKGVHVVGKFYEGGRHGIFVGDPSMSLQVFRLLKTLH
ncbi:Carboxylesterase 1 [Vigna angularis]|uniref:Carboxylesterase 1 n=1 Tax=Phaseolus angularis TaxID=3914 RepID=A0A8T0KUI4_PHAAN|nr:Carboxylesterase 1 [Vigna angularis]